MNTLKETFFIIPCGGSGTRLWPLSRKNKPKQLLTFLNNKSLLEQTIDRIATIAIDKNHIGIVTSDEQEKIILEKVGNSIGIVHKEPSARNTAPAILLSCLEIAKKSPDAIIAFLPADHFIPESKKYCLYLKKAITYASQHDKIVTLGLFPTHPATGYGYIQIKTNKINKIYKFYEVEKFHEKPDAQKALEYIKNNNMFWNLGMFVGKVSLFIDEYKKHAPEIFDTVLAYIKTGKNYEQSQAISIDYAIMEKSKNITVLPCDFIWNDVGNLDIFLSLQEKYATQEEKRNTQIINIDAKNNIARTNKKIVTFIGVDNLCLVEDNDVIVVAKRDQVEKIKLIQEKIQENL